MIRPIPVIIPAARNLTVIHSIGGELRELEKGQARVEQCPHPLARQRFATSGSRRRASSVPPVSMAAILERWSSTSARIAAAFAANNSERLSIEVEGTVMRIRNLIGSA